MIDPKMRGYFLTNILIFAFSYFLISFAFESYDRSFEVLLITIIMNKCSDNSIREQRKTINNESTDKKDTIYLYIEDWFMEEVKKEKNIDET